MYQKVSTAEKSSHWSFAQESNFQKLKKVKKFLAESNHFAQQTPEWLQATNAMHQVDLLLHKANIKNIIIDTTIMFNKMMEMLTLVEDYHQNMVKLWLHYLLVLVLLVNNQGLIAEEQEDYQDAQIMLCQTSVKVRLQTVLFFHFVQLQEPKLTIVTMAHQLLLIFRSLKMKKKKNSLIQNLTDLTFQSSQSAQEWMVQMLVEEKFNADKSEDSPQLETGLFKLRVMIKKMTLQTMKSSQLEPHNFQNALAWMDKERDQELIADKLVDLTDHGQILMISNSKPLEIFKIFPNFQPAINGSPPTANQSAPEISPLDAARREPQSHQRETDSRASGPTSQARLPSNQESSQKTVLPTTTSTERRAWELSNEKKNNLFD